MASSPKDTVKEKLSIEEVVGGYVKLQRAGKNLRAPCPFHKERTPSFYVSPERGSFYCFGCGEKGDIFTFVEKMDGVDFMSALRSLAERAGVELTAYRGEKGPSKDERERQFELHEEAVAFYQEELSKRADVREYLNKRGLKDETIATWKLGYAPAAWRGMTERLRVRGYTDDELATSGLAIKAEKEGASTLYDRFRGRIMFPISDPSGRVIGFSGRFFERMPAPAGRPGDKADAEEPAKYLNSPETPLFRKSHVLYGLDRAKAAIRKSNFAILVEGQMDLLMMHQSGFPNALASSGTAFTGDHLRLISHSTKRLVLALDSDEAGVRSALKSAQLSYAAGFDLRIASFPEGKDPADVGRDDPEELKRSVREATTAIEFFLRRLRGLSRDERAFRRAAESDVLPLIAAMESNIDQAHFCEVAAQSLALPVESIRAEVARIRASKKETAVPGKAKTATAPVPAHLPKKALIAGFIIASANEDAIRKAEEILGKERMDEAAALFESEKERLLFTLEQEGSGAQDLDDLLSELSRERLKEEIEEARIEAGARRQSGDEEGENAASRRIQELTRKLHGFGSAE
jgi:DNA primase